MIVFVDVIRNELVVQSEGAEFKRSLVQRRRDFPRGQLNRHPAGFDSWKVGYGNPLPENCDLAHEHYTMYY